MTIQSNILVSIVAFCLIISCTKKKQPSYLDDSLPSSQRTELLLQQMTLDEKIGQMCQYVGEVSNNAVGNEDEKVSYILGLEQRAELIKQGKTGSFLKVPSYKEANYLQELANQSRLKIPLLISTDAIHGHGMYQGATTIYPTAIGIASSFDTLIAHNIAKYTAKEMRATGYHWTFSPNVELTRDARWGRNGECFGEDPHLIGEMGIAMIHGYQGADFSGKENVLACAKHFVAGGVPYNGLNGAPTDISERTLREQFFPPFQKAIDANVYSIMPAHNEVNGIPCHAHEEYLTDLIREEWGFKGFYISDWMDIKRLSTVHKLAPTEAEVDAIAVNAGLDMHMHGPNFLENVQKAVEDGIVPESRIDDAVSKILYAKFQLGLFENRFVDPAGIQDVLLHKDHLALAHEGALKSMVLLKNDNNLLPLNKTGQKLFVTGPNAHTQSMLGDWARVQPDKNVITPLQGIQNIAGADINFVACERYDTISKTTIAQAKNKAAASDVSIVFIGENALRFDNLKTSGENLDRMTIDPPGNQLELVKAIKQTGKPVVVVLINGGPIGSEWLMENADAIIEAWEPGMFGGRAIAEVIFGDYNPAGRLSMTIPRSVGHTQSFYNYKPSAFHRGKPFGSKQAPLYEFGYGLSYTTFDYSNLSASQNDANVKLSFTLTNSGKYDGDEVVLIYLNDLYSSVTTPVRRLVHFERTHLTTGASQEFNITIPKKSFELLDKDMKSIVEPGTFEIIIGDNVAKTEIVL